VSAAPLGLTGTWAFFGVFFWVSPETVNSPLTSRSTQVKEIG
jgi:hypothetical protein